MVKLVDMPDLGSGAARRVGSSPIIRTEKKLLRNQKLFCFWDFFLLIKYMVEKRKVSRLFVKDENIIETNNLFESILYNLLLMTNVFLPNFLQ